MDTWTAKQLQLMTVGGNQELKDFFHHYSIEGMDVPTKYRTKAAYFYREKLKFLSEGRPLIKDRPSAEEGIIVIEEERKAMPPKQLKENKNEGSSIKNMMEGAIAGAKGIGRNIKESVNEISMKNVGDGAKNALSKIEHRVESWKVKETLSNVRSKTESYYSSIAESAKNTLTKYALMNIIKDDKLEQGEDELLLDPQGKNPKKIVKGKNKSK